MICIINFNFNFNKEEFRYGKESGTFKYYCG